MNIPADTRQFGMKSILAVVTSFAVAFGISSYIPVYRFLLPAAAGLFWLGMVLFVISDNVDAGPIDNRSLFSQLANVLGILLVISAIVGTLICLAMNVLAAILN